MSVQSHFFITGRAIEEAGEEDIPGPVATPAALGTAAVSFRRRILRLPDRIERRKQLPPRTAAQSQAAPARSNPAPSIACRPHTDKSIEASGESREAGPAVAMSPPVELTLVVAATRAMGIGAKGTLPWTGLRKEMAYFARVTKRLPPEVAHSFSYRLFFFIPISPVLLP